MDHAYAYEINAYEINAYKDIKMIRVSDLDELREE